MTFELAVTALRMAIILAGRGHHRSWRQGGQFRSKKYAMMLRNNGSVGSMGRVASAGDNAAIDSFFALLEGLNRKRWVTRNELRRAIVTCIERTYHRRRRQGSLGKITPIEFETIYS